MPHDFWAAYLNAKAKHGNGGVSAPPVIAHDQEGPSAKRFGEQDGRLAQLKAQFSSLQQEQQAIKAEVSGSAERLQAQLDEVKSDCSSFQASFSQQLQENMATLQAAQAAQLQAQASQRPMDWQADS